MDKQQVFKRKKTRLMMTVYPWGRNRSNKALGVDIVLVANEIKSPQNDLLHTTGARFVACVQGGKWPSVGWIDFQYDFLCFEFVAHEAAHAITHICANYKVIAPSDYSLKGYAKEDHGEELFAIGLGRLTSDIIDGLTMMCGPDIFYQVTADPPVEQQ